MCCGAHLPGGAVFCRVVGRVERPRRLGSPLLLAVLKKTIGLRADQDDETVGLDLSQHGEGAYNDRGSGI